MKTFKNLLILLLLGAVVFGVYLNWDRVAPLFNPSGAEAAEATPVGMIPAPDTRHRLVLLDVTTSTDASFKNTVKATLAAAVASYIPERPEVTKDGVAGIAGLELTVRLVGTKPLEYGAPHYAVSIPAVDGLRPRPDMTAEGALDPDGAYPAWKKSEEAWETQYAAAQSAAATAAAEIADIDTALDEWSAITAGAVALALLAPADGDVAFLVASDLDDNQADQKSGSFNGHPFLIVQPNPSGNVSRADGLFAAFSSWATAQGAGPITRVLPEVAESHIQDFVKGDRP